jgi:hypothetical protein
MRRFRDRRQEPAIGPQVAWIPDVDDVVHRTASQLLGDDFILLGDDAFSDAEVEQQLHSVIERLAEQGISLGINETVPERLAYRYLLEELRQGMYVMPGWVLDGCDGCCEECFQLPFCKAGKELAEECDGGWCDGGR